MQLIVKRNPQYEVTAINQGLATVTLKKGIKVIKSCKGPQGPAGLGSDDLAPRVAALEGETDGLTSGAAPLDYYNLAVN